MATATRATASQVGLIRLSDLPDGDGFHRSWVMVLPEGKYQHDEFGEIDLTRPVLDEMVRNFDEKARGIDIALDYDHQASKGDSKAPGWIEAVQYRPATGETPAGLWAKVRWTEIGLHDVKAQVYRYLSAEFKPDYRNDITGKRFNNVLTGLTLTNRPYMKQMPAIQLSKFERPGHYTDKDRKQIPESDFAGPGRTFPIVTQQDVHDAARLIGHAANPAAVKARIKAIAKRKGFALPKEWEAESSGSGDGGSAGMAERDLNDLSLYEDASEDPDLRNVALADSGGKASKKTAKNAAPAYDNDADDDEVQYADGMDDAEEYAENEDAGAEEFDSKSDTHGAMTCDEHSHGKYGPHSHDDDGDHSEAPVKLSRKMSERDETLTLDEMRRELAELRRENYANKAAVILANFESGTFQFTATEARTVSKKSGQPLDGEPVLRSGRFKLAPKAQRAVREWLLSDAAYTLSEGERTRFLSVIEQVIKGVVDLSVRGSSHDMEREKTVTLKSPSERRTSKARTLDELRLETAREIALAEGKNFDALRSLQTHNSREGIQAARDVERIYLAADKQIERNSITTAE